MTRVWYDTEFWEQGSGKPILPISYGFVREDGQELYLIDEAAPLAAIANDHDWLRENVLPHLPVIVDKLPSGGWAVEWDESHPDIDNVVSPGRLRHMVEAFLLSAPDLELWGWYSAYDHVVLAQTFGTMSEMPQGIPYYTNDVRQCIPRSMRIPVQQAKETAHNALADALWTQDVHAWWLGKVRDAEQSVAGSTIGGSVTQIHHAEGNITL